MSEANTPSPESQRIAEKIYSQYGSKGSWNLFDKKIINAIASAIDEARKEAGKC